VGVRFIYNLIYNMLAQRLNNDYTSASLQAGKCSRYLQHKEEIFHM